MGSFPVVDWLVVAAYFAVVFGVVVWAYRGHDPSASSAGYFLAGRNVGWFVVGASLFASNIGSEHLVGLAGTGANSGIAVAQFEIIAALALLLLGWVLVPFYIRSGVFTMPEFLERRYSPAARWYLSVISIIGYVLTKISVTLYAGGIVFEALMGIDFWTGALIVVVVTGVYTAFGGLRVVLYTDMMQMLVLLLGAVVVTVVGLVELGGWGALRESVDDSFFTLWKPIDDPEFPWTGILFGAPIVAVWYWCTDQFIVQRTLSASDNSNARRGSIFAGLLKQAPLFIFVLPGVIAAALASRGELELPQADQALPTLVTTLLPVGLRGLVVAGLLAALMSSLSSVFNSTSTLFTWDIYRAWRPDASERHLVWVGRLATVALTVLGLAWVPFMQYISPRLYVYLQSVQSYIAPPIAAVFLLGVAWRRINGAGAIASLLVGFVLGAGRLVLELVHGTERQGLPAGSVWATIAEINFLHFAVVLFAISIVILVVVSLATAPPAREQVAGLTYATATEPVAGGVEAEERPADVERPGWRRTDLVLTAVLLAIIAVLWIVFA